MVAKRTMAKVVGDRLGLVEPLVEREVVLCDPAPFTNRREGVMIALSHRCVLTKRGCRIRQPCRSAEHSSELQSLMRKLYAAFFLNQINNEQPDLLLSLYTTQQHHRLSNYNPHTNNN